MSPVIRRRLTPTALVDEPGDLASLQAAGDETQGVYTVCNTQGGGRVFRLDAHLDRIEESAARQGFDVRLPRRRIRRALRGMLDESGFGEMRFRLSVPRQAPDQVLIAIEPWQAPADNLRRDGLRCVIARALRAATRRPRTAPGCGSEVASGCRRAVTRRC